MLEGIRRVLGLSQPGTKLRRTDLKLAPSSGVAKFRATVTHPAFVPTLLCALLLIAVTSATIWWSRSKIPVAVGRVMDTTRAVRVEFKVKNEEGTQRDRDDRRARSPRLYNADEALFTALEQSLLTLPTAVASTATLADVAPEIRDSFGLTEEQLAAVRAEVTAGEASELWRNRVGRVMRRLEREPFLSSEEYQRVLQSSTDRMELHRGPSADNVLKDSAINIDGELFKEKVRSIVESAGFTGPRFDAVVQRLTRGAKPTFVYDEEATRKRGDEEAAKARDQIITYRPGDVIFERGKTLTRGAYDTARREDTEFRRQMPTAAVLLQHAGIVGLMGVVTLALLGYLRLYYPRILRSPARFGAVAAIVGLTSFISCWLGVNWPGWVWVVAVGPVLFSAMVLVVAYDPRVALVLGMAQTVVIGVALELPVGYFAVVITGIAVAGWRLREIRTRNDVIAAAVLVAVAAGVATLIIGLLERQLGGPSGEQVLFEVIGDAVLAGVGGFAAGALLLVCLPAVERVFDVVTGMTLSEWRDPRRPLLRELQQRAPGTFNHSHTVGTLAESAAEAIGADGLHLYVGALYHDIGKMIKPEYFVENQAGGFNRHTRLSPAMSLLVIVGHVKDGLELAREHNVPRSLHHYIESHHGTTLVQYFYDAAKKQAEGDSSEQPEEVEYRYPGPRPRTKEAAILMIADAVESATRAMAEPTPARIAALVHSLANKRLMDGQFDECALTLRELAVIEDAIIKGLCAIYHGRIAYPTEATGDLNDTIQRQAKQTAERMG
ncbi:MAG TPA: HDIG domain-containing protein [Phycisphaerales bacterium]|nr:HDIG domain-containing protein [Phycisphaerales bacterium]